MAEDELELEDVDYEDWELQDDDDELDLAAGKLPAVLAAKYRRTSP